MILKIVVSGYTMTMQQGLPFDVTRPWGSFRQFTDNTSCTVKLISINPNEVISLQSHHKRSELWRVIHGSGHIQIADQDIVVKVGDEHVVPIDTKHRISADAEGIEVLEISFGEFDEDDIIRYEDKYGRIS